MTKQRRDIHQEVTDAVIAAIEDGRADREHFVMPWTRGSATGAPLNATTGNHYRGANILNLWVSGIANQYDAPLWASFKQWQQRGAQVRKGERGTAIVFYKTITKETGERDMITGEPGADSFRVLRHSTVFNVDQVDGFDAPAIERPNLAERIATAEDFVTATGAEVRRGERAAFYDNIGDFVGMPDMDRFRDTPSRTATEAYYGTLLHELTHWTKAPHRLDRQLGKKFGTTAQAAEELVAELGAAFLAAELGLESEPRLDHAHYIDSWLQALKNDKTAIFTAAARASDAVEYLTNLQPHAQQIAA